MAFGGVEATFLIRNAYTERRKHFAPAASLVLNPQTHTTHYFFLIEMDTKRQDLSCCGRSFEIKFGKKKRILLTTEIVSNLI